MMPSAPFISPANKILSQNTIEILRSNSSVKGIVSGETFPATVLEKSAGNKYLLALKNLHITATSDIPLNIGDKFLVKVNSVQPQTILNIVERNIQNSDTAINDKLRQWRANPESLVQVINKLAGFAKLFQSEDLPPNISRSNVEKIIKLFDDIILSPRTINNPLFIKDFVSKIGLMLEHSLQQLANGVVNGRREKPLEDNLKALLIKLSSAVGEVLRGKSKLDVEIMAKLTKILSFTDEALKTIETKQVLNSVFQESDNGLVLQIPMALEGGFSLADVFITLEGKEGQGKKKFSSCSVAVFLDLDALDKIAVYVSVREGNFNCVIKCEKAEVKDTISNNLDDLKQALTGIGYRLGYIDCVQENGLTDEREEFVAQQSFAASQLLNFFV